MRRVTVILVAVVVVGIAAGGWAISRSDRRQAGCDGPVPQAPPTRTNDPPRLAPVDGRPLVSSRFVGQADTVVVATVVRASRAQERVDSFGSASTTTTLLPYLVQGLVLRGGHVIKGESMPCWTDVIAAFQRPPVQVRDRLVYSAGIDPLTHERYANYVPVDSDGTVFSGYRGTRVKVDSWRLSDGEARSPSDPVCPGGPRPGDPKDCFPGTVGPGVP